MFKVIISENNDVKEDVMITATDLDVDKIKL